MKLQEQNKICCKLNNLPGPLLMRKWWDTLRTVIDIPYNQIKLHNKGIHIEVVHFVFERWSTATPGSKTFIRREYKLRIKLFENKLTKYYQL